MKQLKLIALFLCFGTSVYAQDLIYKKNNEIILAKIIEMGLDEIKYKDYANPNGITQVIAKDEVTKVKFENGKVQFIVSSTMDGSAYADNKKHALKIDFLAPMFGQTTISYERSLKPGESYEINLGIIGLGVNNYKTSDSYLYNSYNEECSSSGAFVRFGYKFIRSPDFYLRGMQYSHVLKGSYFKPEVTFGACREKLYSSYNDYNFMTGKDSLVTKSYNKQVTFVSLMLTFGKQWVFNNKFLFDNWVSIGYGFSSKANDSDYTNFNLGTANNHAFIGPFTVNPFSYSLGLKLGYLF